MLKFNSTAAAAALVAAGLTAGGLAMAAPAASAGTQVSLVADTSRAAGWPLLQNGSSGKDVRALQHLLLCSNGDWELDVDGRFGSDTKEFVQLYQRRNGLTADGKVGAKTWGKLTNGRATVRKGDRSQCVAAAQVQLGMAATENFDQAMHDKVVAFQRRVGIPADGIVGPGTWRELIVR